MLIKTADAAGLFTKNRYDGAGRLVGSKTSYDVYETAYADADDCEGDLEKTKTWYDGDGNVIVQANFKRFENDTTTLGCINGTNSYASSAVNWYDADGVPY